MTGTLRNQLDEYGMPERWPEVIDEIVRVREELGQPIMATPFSQFVGIQAVLNVVLDERYEVVPDEVLHYALGHYGPLMRPVEPEIADKIFSQPRVKDLEKWERDQTTLDEFRRRLGPSLSDEELLLRYLAPQEHVDKMLASGPLRTEPPARSPELGEQLMELIAGAESRPISHFSLSRPGITIDLRRD
jgi:oxaloacetate decarboxylase alpha subunit